MRLILACSAALLASSLLFVGNPARAEEATPSDEVPQGKEIEYEHDGVALRGFLVPAAGEAKTKRPAILLVHAWRGHSENVRAHATRLAAQGRTVFALDMYGTGVYAKDNGEAAKLAGPFYAKPSLMRARAKAGLEVLRRQPDVDPKRIVAAGFCFGGTTVLEMARDGAEIAGVVSFHGGLTTKQRAEPGTVKARVLACHGGDDPYVPEEDVLGFWSEMRETKVDHQILILSDAVHAFTDAGAGDDPSKGAAYAPKAAAQAWSAFERFVTDTLGS